MKFPKKIAGIIGAVVVAVIIVTAVALSLVVFPQPHMAFISEQKASSILNETFWSGPTNNTGVNNAFFQGAASISSIAYSGSPSVVIAIAQYNDTSSASAFYAKQCINISSIFTLNATYKGYKFSYAHSVNIRGYLFGPVEAWCLLKNYFVDITSFMSGTFSNTTIVNFVHTQMDAML